MFVIIQWNSYADVSLVCNADGAPALFVFRREAEAYAKEHLAFEWQVIYLD